MGEYCRDYGQTTQFFLPRKNRIPRGKNRENTALAAHINSLKKSNSVSHYITLMTFTSQATITWESLFDEDQIDPGASFSSQTCPGDDLGTQFELYRAGEVPPSRNVERFY